MAAAKKIKIFLLISFLLIQYFIPSPMMGFPFLPLFHHPLSENLFPPLGHSSGNDLPPRKGQGRPPEGHPSSASRRTWEVLQELVDEGRLNALGPPSFKGTPLQ